MLITICGGAKWVSWWGKMGQLGQNSHFESKNQNIIKVLLYFFPMPLRYNIPTKKLAQTSALGQILVRFCERLGKSKFIIVNFLLNFSNYLSEKFKYDKMSETTCIFRTFWVFLQYCYRNTKYTFSYVKTHGESKF